MDWQEEMTTKQTLKDRNLEIIDTSQHNDNGKNGKNK